MRSTQGLHGLNALSTREVYTIATLQSSTRLGDDGRGAPSGLSQADAWVEPGVEEVGQQVDGLVEQRA